MNEPNIQARSEAEEGQAACPSPDFHYDEWCDLLGGGEWAPVLNRWFRGGLSPERGEQLSAHAAELSEGPQFLFADEQTGRFPLEILWLKWSLFAGLCRSTLAFYRRRAGPHLAIRPDRVRIAIQERGEVVPSRWRFRAVLTDAGTAQSVSLPGLPADLRSRLFEAPEKGDPVYSAPVLRRAVLGREEPATALILSAEPVRDSPEGSTRGLVEVHLISDGLRSAGCASADVFRVTLTLPDAQASLVGLWADGAQASRRGLVVRGTTDPLTPSCWERLKRAGQTVFANTRVIVYPSFHAPCDVYSLGMMLFRTLLVNDAQDMERVADVVTRVASRLEPMVQGQGEGSRAVLAARLRRRLEDEDGLFASDAVLYRKEDRTVESRRVVPYYLWYDALLLGFRMVSGVPEFSLCRDYGDYDRQAPHALLERVVAVAEDVDARIRLELFGSPQRNREILEACDAVKRELAALGGG